MTARRSAVSWPSSLRRVAWSVSRRRRAFAQQRPLVTEDPETIGAGRLLIEAGLDLERDVSTRSAGSRQSLSVPTFGVSVGLSSIAEIQIDGGLYQRLDITRRRPAPLSGAARLRRATARSDVEDFVLATKIRLFGETPPAGRRSACGLPPSCPTPATSPASAPT